MEPGEQLIPRPAGARPGPPAPWAEAGPDARRGVTIERVRSGLHLGDPTTAETVARLEADPKGEAGVLVPLFEEAGETRVILTRRAAHLRSHTGQVAFPGGRLEPGEDAVAALLTAQLVCDHLVPWATAPSPRKHLAVCWPLFASSLRWGRNRY